MNMGYIRNRKLTPTKKETFIAEKKHMKQCALETNEATEWTNFQAMEDK
jgi:hypothetical protein